MEKEITPASLAQHMAALRQSEPWQILLQYMAQEREKIIEEGKKSRKEEKYIRVWAKLDGFDTCAALPEKLFNYGRQNSEMGVEEGDE